MDQEEQLSKQQTELNLAGYKKREGYLETFLGDEVIVPLPLLWEEDKILTFGSELSESILKYMHFSIQMNKERRLCFYSAVNINGALACKTNRLHWRLDPRIRKEDQIIEECSGNSPKLSMGYMTRREDPAWGDIEQATAGSADAMFVTNTVPCLHYFNAPIWLGLEDYAMQHANVNDMKICVFTGPLFADNDPVMFAIKIPIKFWKVIAFIHDDTGKLTATGYIVSPNSFPQSEESVLAEYRTYQTSISLIEEKAKINFGPLTGLDPYHEQEAIPSALQSFSQIILT